MLESKNRGPRLPSTLNRLLDPGALSSRSARSRPTVPNVTRPKQIHPAGVDAAMGTYGSASSARGFEFSGLYSFSAAGSVSTKPSASTSTLRRASPQREARAQGATSEPPKTQYASPKLPPRLLSSTSEFKRSWRWLCSAGSLMLGFAMGLLAVVAVSSIVGPYYADLGANRASALRVTPLTEVTPMTVPSEAPASSEVSGSSMEAQRTPAELNAVQTKTPADGALDAAEEDERLLRASRNDPVFDKFNESELRNLSKNAARTGRTAQRLGHAALARASFVRALRYRPENPEGAVGMARVHLQEGSASRALSWARRAVEVAPQWPAAWMVLGDALLASQQREEAVRSFERVIELDPDHRQARRRIQNL
ncbi:MAG: tetratricopeptide repeat protein [Myxococcota bacterium]